MERAAQPSVDERETIAVDRRGRRELGRASWWTQWVCLISAAPWLLFPELRTSYGWTGVILLVAQQAVRLLDAEERRRTLDLDVAWPMAGIAAMAVVALLVSPDYQVGLPPFFGILFGIGVYAAIVSSLRTTRLDPGPADRLWVAVVAYATIGVIVATAAFLLAMPALSRWDPVVAFYEARPELPMEAKQWLGKVGLGVPHPNRVADVLTLFLPFYLALLVYRPWHRIGAHGAPTDDSGLRRLVRPRWLLLASGLALAWVGLVFLATLSRAAYVGMAISIIFLLAYRWPRVRPALRSAAFGLVLLFGLWLAWLLVSDPSQSRHLSETIRTAGQAVDLGRTESASGSFTWRLALWSLVLELIAQHPWAGIGFNMLPPYSEQVPYMDGYLNALHAHNLALQVALDVGLPGLACLLAVLTIALASCCRALRELRGTSHEAVVAGIMGALLAFLVATLADIVPLGSKSSVLFWMLLGLAVCLPRAHRTTRQELPRALRR